jgi:uncharacterized protein (TIGR03000 family)
MTWRSTALGLTAVLAAVLWVAGPAHAGGVTIAVNDNPPVAYVAPGYYRPYYYPASYYAPGLYAYAAPAASAYTAYYYPAGTGYANYYYRPAYTAAADITYYPRWWYDTPAVAYERTTAPGYASYYYRPTTVEVPAPAPAAPDVRQRDDSAHVLVHVPPDALVWFNGEATTQTGSEREFISPPLDARDNYSYEIIARWNDAGRPVVSKQKVRVTANTWRDVDMTQFATLAP